MRRQDAANRYEACPSDRGIRGEAHSIEHVQLETIMGLMDVLRGMQHGPHGQPPSRTGTGTGTGTGTSSTGMSPITMAILGLLAYKALKSMSHHEEAAPAGGPRPSGGGLAGGGLSGEGLSDLLKGALGGLLAGSAAGGVMSGGVNDLIKQMQKRGFADTADSWVGEGPNRTIAPGDLAKVFGADQIDAMMQHSGLSRDELLEGLSRHLPEVIDRLTPEGEVPRHIPM
jgi:uncharacterized protein YidB (DUF937 family)